MNNSIVEIYSKGLYSSWCYHKPSRTLFDCGEGFASYQGNYIYGIERVMISHGHGDHVLGLPSLIGCRNSARGDREKPLIIYYPYGDKLVESVRDFINVRNEKHLRYKVEWKAISPGHEIDLGNNQTLVSFEMEHQKNNKLTLGYHIIEKRHRLKTEYAGANIPELLKSGINKEDLKDNYNAITFAYTLDAFNFNPVFIKNADLVVMDCTFIKPEDRDDYTHFSLHEAYDMCIQSNVKHMIAAHFSPRYIYPNIKSAVEKLNKDAYHNYKKSTAYITPVYHNQVTEI